MILIESLTQYKMLILQNRQRFAKVESNCFLMPNDVKRMIDEGRLKANIYEKGLYLFAEEKYFSKLYYFWDASSEFFRPPQGKTLLVEEMGSESWKKSVTESEEKLSRSGFRRYKRNLQFTVNMGERALAIERELPSRLAHLNEIGIRIIPCDTSFFAEQTVALWYKELDKTDIPEKHTQFMSCEDDHVVCTVNDKNEVVGAYWWRIEGKGSGEGRHIVTRQDHLRQGIGTALLLHSQKELLSRGISRMLTWISASNEKSILLHKGVGFQKNGRFCIQYILEQE